MSEIKITLEDGSVHKYPKYTTYYEMSKDFTMPGKIIGVIVNNRITSLGNRAEKDCKVEWLDMNSRLGNRIYASGLRFIFECAAYKMFPGIKVEYAYSLPRGVVASLHYEKYLNNEDISLIRKTMSSLVTRDIKIEKLVVKSRDGIDYYEERGDEVKAVNIKLITDPTIVLYRLEDVINYYYSEMPYSTGVINKYEVRYLGKNMIALNFPGQFDEGRIPDYVNYQPIIDSYNFGQDWLSKMKVPYIKDVNRQIYSGKITNFVRSSELGFNLLIFYTAKKIVESSNYKYVMIAGPSTSGKTTITKRLASYFELFGLDPIVLSSDNYFRERVDTPKDDKGRYDFECLQAIDLEYLASDMKKLLKGEEITLPKFNFETGRKEVSSKKVKLKENSIILFEGLHTINDDLLPMFPTSQKFKIYVSPFNPLSIDEHNYIPNEDLRLLRRIVRDFRTRGFSVEKVIESNTKVLEGEAKYINPYIHQADAFINTSLPYELGVLKVYVEPLLFAVPQESKYYNEARRLLSFLKQFFSISSEYVPIDSILREFIGGEKDD